MTREEYLKVIRDWSGWIDPNLEEDENVIRQANHDNDTEYTLEEVEVGLPTEIREVIINPLFPNDPIEVNTRVIIKAREDVLNNRYRGSDSYCYRRLDIAMQYFILWGNKDISLPREDMTDSEIKRYLKKRMPFRYESLIVKKVLNKTGRDYIEVTPIKNSLLYIGLLRIPIKGTSKDNDPVVKLNKYNPNIDGLDYITKNTLLIDGLDYITKVVELEGLDYITRKRISLEGLDYIN